MPERSQKRKLRRDPPDDHELAEESSLQTDENNCTSEQDFEDISSEVENKVSKGLRDTEHCQREILKLKILLLHWNSTTLTLELKLAVIFRMFRHRCADVPGPSNAYSNSWFCIGVI